ncbi:hypothetical protein [Pedobacter sp.]|uniref:hypothetical protein n=1 Tax=Pedobacter sp. TaxID=1411316 RepID=UPI003D7FE4AC
MKTKKRILLFTALLLPLMVSTELVLRNYFGFCHEVLMKSDPDIEYINLANQHTQRFRKNYHYNEYSMRSNPIDSSCIHILGFGDSIINRGDHDDLATTLLSNSLSTLYHQKVQFLNVSAGSWGPDNCFAYLKKNGDFQAKKIYLFVSSHDAFDNMTFEKIVGVSKSHPDKQYSFAIYELLDRYLIPRMTLKKNIQASVIDHIPEGAPFNSGFGNFKDYTAKKDIPFILFLHASIPELKEGKYNSLGQKIIEFAKQNDITMIQDINMMTTEDYEDQLHINASGQKKVAAAVLAHYQK